MKSLPRLLPRWGLLALVLRSLTSQAVRLKLFFILAALSVLQPVPARSAAPADFTIAVLPDTQFYAKEFPQSFQAQVNWIISNRVSLNIVYVAHLGDIVDTANDPAQWRNATNAMFRLENPVLTGLPEGIPYGVVPGNHDHGESSHAKLYNENFSVAHFQKKTWYGGHFRSDNNNHFDRFSAAGLDFVVVYLDYWLSKKEKVDLSAEDAWVDEVLRANANRRAILVTHTAVTPKNALNARGQEIYDRLKKNPNLFLMLCGHISGEGRCQNVFEGRTVHACLSDYQNKDSGGNGWLRLCQFSPASNRITVKTYSPTLNQWQTGSASQFTLEYAMSDAK